MYIYTIYTYTHLRGHDLNLGQNHQAWVQAQRRGESVFFSIRTIRTNIRESLKITPEAPWGFREAPPVKLPEFPWSFPDASQKLPEAFWSFPEASRTSESFPEASWENFFWSFKKISQREIFLQTCCACKSATGRLFLKFKKKSDFFEFQKKKSPTWVSAYWGPRHIDSRVALCRQGKISKKQIVHKYMSTGPLGAVRQHIESRVALCLYV